MNRRRAGVLIAAGTLGVLAKPALVLARASFAGFPRPPPLGDADARFIARGDKASHTLSRAYNTRTMRLPELRVMCRTDLAVATVVAWAREHSIPFAVRSGGHCFAGFSQHSRLVIDVRELNAISVDPQHRLAHAGAGATLGMLHRAVAARSLAVIGGICPEVGLGGQVLGGGVGHLSRWGGLLCDHLKSLTLVDAEGRVRQVSKHENADLLWASRGGGGGSFGVATKITLGLRPLPIVHNISVHRSMPKKAAANLLAEWLHWSVEQSRNVTTHFDLTRYGREKFLVSLTGQSAGERADLLKSLRSLLGGRVENFERNVVSTAYRNVPGNNQPQLVSPHAYNFTRSDLMAEPLSRDLCTALLNLLQKYPVNGVSLKFETLGGAVDDLAADATAYPHRGNARHLIQYASNLHTIFQRDERLAALSAAHAFMRPHVTGGAYVNYRDDMLEDWAQAYWGRNLPRLMEIKRKWDLDNFFRHAQSVPVG